MLLSDYCGTCNTSSCCMWQYIMKNVKRLELFKFGLGAISSIHYLSTKGQLFYPDRGAPWPPLQWACHLLEIDWKAELKGRSIQGMWNFICDKYYEFVDEFVPMFGCKKKITLYIEQNIKIHQGKTAVSFQHIHEDRRTQYRLPKLQGNMILATFAWKK